jgi:hypothetical protein
VTDDGPLTPEELDRALERFFGSREEARKLLHELYDRDAVQELAQIAKAARFVVVVPLRRGPGIRLAILCTTPIRMRAMH